MPIDSTAPNVSGDSPETVSAEQEHRRAPRYSTRDLAIVTLGASTQVSAEESYPVQLHDLSPRGARFSARIPLTRGDHFVIYLPHGAQRVALLCSAVHVVKRPDGQTIVGAEFSCVIGRDHGLPTASACLEEAELSRIRGMMLGN